MKGDVGAIPQQHKHGRICSKQWELFLLCACRWVLGSGPPLLLGQFSCGNKKSTVRKCPVSVMQKEGEERQGLGVKSLPVDIMIPVVQNFTPAFLRAIWGDVFFLSTFLTLNPLRLMLADACGPHELLSRCLCPPCHEFAEGSLCVGKFLLMAWKSSQTPEMAETGNGVHENQVFLFHQF